MSELCEAEVFFLHRCGRPAVYRVGAGAVAGERVMMRAATVVLATGTGSDSRDPWSLSVNVSARSAGNQPASVVQSCRKGHLSLRRKGRR